MDKPLFLLNHLGLGDHLICCGLVRVLAERNPQGVIIPCYPHNLQAVTFMFRDDPRIQVVEAQSSTHAAGMAVAHGNENTLALGYYFIGKFNPHTFDQEFYSQANVRFSDRWDEFRVDRPVTDTTIRPGFAFVHHDTERGFVIRDELIRGRVCNFVDKKLPFFDWLPTIMQSEEIHVINSSFLCLIDSLEPVYVQPQQRLYLHAYARPNGETPTLKREWVVIP